LLTIDRIRAIEPIWPASCSKPSASWMPLSAVLIALVPPAAVVPGWGSNVSSWLGPPESQSKISDRAGSRECSACRARSWPTDEQKQGRS